MRERHSLLDPDSMRTGTTGRELAGMLTGSERAGLDDKGLPGRQTKPRAESISQSAMPTGVDPVAASVLNVICGPIHRRRCGPTCVTISTCAHINLTQSKLSDTSTKVHFYNLEDTISLTTRQCKKGIPNFSR